MSSATSSSPSTPQSSRSNVADAIGRGGRSAVDGVQAIAFWGAALLPVAYLPALIGVAPTNHAELFVGMIALHVVCAVVGHGYST